MIKKFPFLKYDHTDKYNKLDEMPEGWKKAFGELICEDIKSLLIKHNFLDEYVVTQIKEKFGSLRWYDNFFNEEHYHLINKYEHISKHTCINCSKFNVKTYNFSWIIPLCEDCAKDTMKRLGETGELKDYIYDDKPFVPIYNYCSYSKNGDKIVTLDCSDIIERMNTVKG